MSSNIFVCCSSFVVVVVVVCCLRGGTKDDVEGGVFAPRQGLLAEMEKQYEAFCRTACKWAAWCSCAFNVFGGKVLVESLHGCCVENTCQDDVGSVADSV